MEREREEERVDKKSSVSRAIVMRMGSYGISYRLFNLVSGPALWDAASAFC